MLSSATKRNMARASLPRYLVRVGVPCGVELADEAPSESIDAAVAPPCDALAAVRLLLAKLLALDAPSAASACATMADDVVPLSRV